MSRSARASFGSFLFRWRSYLPLLLIVPGILGLVKSGVYYEANYERLEDLFTLLCLGVSLLGLAIRCVTVGFVPQGTSGRNTKGQRADFLNTTGMYSVVRNPLYLGNFVAMLGVVLAVKAWWFGLLFLACYGPYIACVIAAEESFLLDKYGAEYAAWRARTPVFLPNFTLWRRPSLPFSARTVLRRESYGLMAICVSFFVIEFVLDILVENETVSSWLAEDWPWAAFLVAGSIIFVVLRYLKKNTQVLAVSGR